ncbi:Gfo/Idh/MocA family oxidoreductase [bacterium]|nr:Gfo/Idh/MocA family oxidoreductase [bacterium]
MSPLPDKPTRREFVAATAPLVVASTVLGSKAKAAPSERVGMGHIGCGGRGGAINRVGGCRNAQSVAYCDPYKSRRDRARGTKPGTADFRELLARDDVDAVTVATPDHWHVPIAVAAAKAGKDMYVEKPLGTCITEDLICRDTIRRYGRMFQYGTQQRSSRHCRFGCELVRSGYIGEVKSIEVVAPNGGRGGSVTPCDPPADLDYNLWIGPAPMVPYTRDRCKTPGTYFIYDYSIGFLGGWGAHPLDIMVWGYDIHKAGVCEVSGTGVIPDEGLYDAVINWDLNFKFANGLKLHFTPGGDFTKFIGTEGWVGIRRGGIDAHPKSLLKQRIGPNDVHLVESRHHGQNFVDSCISRKDPVSFIDDAVRSDLISLLSDIAVRTGRPIRWDWEAEALLGDPAAQRMLARPYRAPWSL